MSYDQNRISVFWSVVCLPSCKKIGAKVAARKVSPTASSIRKESGGWKESLWSKLLSGIALLANKSLYSTSKLSILSRMDVKD